MACFNCTNLFSFAKETLITEMITNYLAFTPPQTVNYTIKEIGDERETHGPCIKPVEFIHSTLEKQNIYPWLDVKGYQIKKWTNSKHKIIVLHIKKITVYDCNKNTLIFSHGNSSDLNSVYPLLIDLATQLKVNKINVYIG